MAQTFTATSPSFAHVNAAVLQARDGDTVVIPANGAGVPFVAWASTDVLNINFDMQIIGAGIDATHASPDPAVCTIIRCTNLTGAMFSATYNGTEFVSRISKIIIEVTTT